MTTYPPCMHAHAYVQCKTTALQNIPFRIYLLVSFSSRDLNVRLRGCNGFRYLLQPPRFIFIFFAKCLCASVRLGWGM